MKSIVATPGSGEGATGLRAATLREETRYLWTRLQLHPRFADAPRARVAFCTTRRGEGVTSVATNFAILLGEQGRRALLVEANLRRPVLARHFRRRTDPGLIDILDGTSDVESALRTQLAPGLDLLPAGSPPPDPYASCLGIGELFEDLALRADLLVVDMPPLSTSPEAGLLLQHADLAVLVVAANNTGREEVSRSIAMLQDFGVPLAGAVLNGKTHDLPVAIDRLL